MRREGPRDGDPPRVAFGRRLRELREAAGLLQSDVAARAGVSAPYLSELEHGQRNPTLDVMTALAHALGTSLGALFADDYR